MRTSLGTVYVIVGVVVAAMHDYFDNLSTVKLIAEAMVAVIIWPFVLAGVEVSFK